MCMVDYADGDWTFLGESLHIAKKEHRCEECHRAIEPGEQYERASGIFEGHFETFKTCRHCIAVREWLRKVCGGFLYCGVYEDLDEHRRETDYNPRWLNVAVSGMRRKWRNKDGTMRRPMSLPKKLPIPEHAHA